MSLFSDNFTRADGAIGNGWSTIVNGSGFSQGISTNRFFATGNNGGNGAIFRTDISPISGVAVTFKFSSTADASMRDLTLWTRWGDTLTTGGYGVTLINASSSANNVSIQDTSHTQATTTFAFNTTDTFQIEVDVSADPQNWMDVYIWNTNGGSKPGTPTLSWHNSGSNYTPFAVGTGYGIQNDPNHGTTETLFGYLYQVDAWIAPYVAETVTVSESVVIVITVLKPSINDTVTVSENIQLTIPGTPILISGINDTVTVSENVKLSYSLSNLIFDSATVSENVKVLVVDAFSVTDSITVSENIQILQKFPVVGDIVTVSENVKLDIMDDQILNEVISISENLNLVLVAQSLFRPVGYFGGV